MKKIIGLIIICFMVSSLLVTVYAQKAPKTKQVPSTTPRKPPTITEVPKYGGTLTVMMYWVDRDPTSWDPAENSWPTNCFNGPYMEQLLTGDYLSKGLRGTKEFDFSCQDFIPTSCLEGELAEKWEMLDPLTFVFKIRKGVYFPNKPGVMSQREFTAHDAAFALNRWKDSPKIPKGKTEVFESFAAVDNYTLKVKMKYFDSDWLNRIGWSMLTHLYPPELVQAGIADWKNQIGTGPFMLTEFVKGSQLVYEHNPIYWRKITNSGKKYQLPFVDKLVFPIIKDESTQIAALRTGKVDIHTRVSWRYKGSLESSTPQLRRWRYLEPIVNLTMLRMDRPPFNDIRVRQAMNMALDKQNMIKSLYGGEGLLLSAPFAASWPKTLYTPLEELPEAAKMLFQYNPEKAKKLIAEAGYPNGFEFEVVFRNQPAWVDMFEMAASYWQAVGLKPKLISTDYANKMSILDKREYKHAINFLKGCNTPELNLSALGDPRDKYCGQMWGDTPECKQFMEMFKKAVQTQDETTRNKILKETNIYWLTVAPAVIFPTEYKYAYAWPWVKNYEGEIAVKYYNDTPVLAGVWTDQAMKDEMLKKMR